MSCIECSLSGTHLYSAEDRTLVCASSSPTRYSHRGSDSVSIESKAQPRHIDSFITLLCSTQQSYTATLQPLVANERGWGQERIPGARPNQDARLDATDCRGELQVPTSRPPARLPAGAEFLPLQGLEHSSGQRAATRDQSVSTRSGWWNERSGYWPIERRAEKSGQGACFCLDYLSARQPSVFWPAEQTVEWTALLQWAAVTQPASVLYSGNASMRPDSVHLIQENVFICCCLGWGGVIGAAGMGGKEARRTGGREGRGLCPPLCAALLHKSSSTSQPLPRLPVAWQHKFAIYARSVSIFGRNLSLNNRGIGGEMGRRAASGGIRCTVQYHWLSRSRHISALNIATPVGT